ncbi:MAG: beta-mannosidase [Gammaproteobacteria bacterium]|nr:beta-mannosidase [Gammaproteobacteria bacterium]
MPTRAKSITGRRRQLLTAGWELCSAPAGAYDGPEALTRAPVEWLAAQAPSTVADCLRAANLWSLDSPARRFDAEEWWYRLRFGPPPRGLEDPTGAAAFATVLGFDGLATVADVWLNGKPLLSSDNMFLAHELPLEEPLEDQNELVIRFRALDRLLEARRPRPKWRAPMVDNQQLRWFRTTLLGRTPGWSPPAAPVGPWRPVWLETRGRFELTDLAMRTGVAGDKGWIEVECRITGTPVAAVVLVAARNTERYSVPLRRRPDSDTYAGRLEIPDVALWWPHTHGEPALYDARLEIASAAAASVLDADLGRVGFRTLALDSSDGAFGLRVNGVPIFCRGACWTPLDPVSLGASVDLLRAALDQVRSAGMNMLRVGGTMVYESDAFLDLCDASGILLWQDFMFANMNYPEDDPAFSASVAVEARQQLARLAARPCLALLCGNSEGEQQAAMWGAPRENWSPRLFHELLAGLARECCPEVPYWPSSAHGGSFPHQANAGTASYYGVGAYLRPLEDARRAEVHFASECLAFANIPDDRALGKLPGGLSIRSHHPAWKARTPRDLGAGWDFDDVRDHYLARLFRVDPLELRYADHERYLALSRVVSGEVMAGVFAEWRRKRSTCRGGLIWFWRDLWCGAGWGIVDALGSPKAPFHYLRRVLQPVSVFISDEGGNGLSLHVTNEQAAPLEAVLELTLYRAGETTVGTGSRPLTIAPRETLELNAGELFEGFVDLSYAYRFGPPQHELVVATLRAAGDRAVISEAFHFVLGLSAAREADIGLTATAVARADSAFDLKIATRRFAQSVWIEADGFVADDAYFHLAPGTEKTVLLQRAPREPERALRGRIHALNALNSTKIELQG